MRYTYPASAPHLLKPRLPVPTTRGRHFLFSRPSGRFLLVLRGICAPVPKRLSMADLSREQLIQRYAQRLKGVLDEIVPQSPNESDFRYRVNRVLDDFCEELGFEIELRTEYGLAGNAPILCSTAL